MRFPAFVAVGETQGMKGLPGTWGHQGDIRGHIIEVKPGL